MKLYEYDGDSLEYDPHFVFADSLEEAIEILNSKKDLLPYIKEKRQEKNRWHEYNIERGCVFSFDK